MEKTQKINLLAFAAHPDDVELSCSGTLMKHIEMGYKVGVIDLTRGELGTRGTPELRLEEAQAAAKIMGIQTHKIMMITWGISSMVGAVAGLLISPTIMHPFMMWDPMLKGFAAAVMGGMTSLPGAVIAAYLLGIIENLFGGYISIEFKSVVAFAIIVLVLCIKPSGLFARHYIKKV